MLKKNIPYLIILVLVLMLVGVTVYIITKKETYCDAEECEAIGDDTKSEEAQHGWGWFDDAVDKVVDWSKDVGSTFEKLGNDIASISVAAYEGAKKVAIGSVGAIGAIRSPMDVLTAVKQITNITGEQVIKVGSQTINLAGQSVENIVNDASFGTLPRELSQIATQMVKDEFLDKADLYIAIGNGNIEGIYTNYKKKYDDYAKTKYDDAKTKYDVFTKIYQKGTGDKLPSLPPSLPSMPSLLPSFNEFKDYGKHILGIKEDISVLDCVRSGGDYVGTECNNPKPVVYNISGNVYLDESLYLSETPKQGTRQQCTEMCELNPECHRFIRNSIDDDTKVAPCWLQKDPTGSTPTYIGKQVSFQRPAFARKRYTTPPPTTLPPYDRQYWTIIGKDSLDKYNTKDSLQGCIKTCNLDNSCIGFTRNIEDENEKSIRGCYFKSSMPPDARIVVRNGAVSRFLKDEVFIINQLVKVYDINTHEYKKGRISQKNSDGTFNIVFNDGTKKNGIFELISDGGEVYKIDMTHETATNAYLKPGFNTTPIISTSPTRPPTTTPRSLILSLTSKNSNRLDLNNNSLETGYYLTSINNQYKLALQYDGNLIIYDVYEKPFWSSNKTSSSPQKVTVDNGYVVCVENNGSVYWKSNSGKNTLYFNLILENNGILNLYDGRNELTWSSNPLYITTPPTTSRLTTTTVPPTTTTFPPTTTTFPPTTSRITTTTFPPTTSRITIWSPNTKYITGNSVSYNNLIYQCIREHTSVPGWEPTKTGMEAFWRTLTITTFPPTTSRLTTTTFPPTTARLTTTTFLPTTFLPTTSRITTTTFPPTTSRLTTTTFPPTTTTFPPTTVNTDTDRIDSKKVGLLPNSYIISKNKQYKLLYQKDGNLVLYNVNNKPIWSINKTSSSPKSFRLLRVSGELICTDNNNVSYWRDNLTPNPVQPFSLILEDTGRLVVYDGTNKAIWTAK